MSTSDTSPAPMSFDDMAQREKEPPIQPVAPQSPESTTSPKQWTTGRVAALAIGVVLMLTSLPLLGAGGTALWIDRLHRDGGFVTSDANDFVTQGSALVTERVDLGSGWTGWLYAPSLLDEVRIRATPADPGATLFVGIAPSTDVDRYLAGVAHTRITDFWSSRVENVGGTAAVSAPATQSFWEASSTGPGQRAVDWHPTTGTWSVVVMNADGTPSIDVRADLGATLPALPWIATGVLLGGAVIAAGAVLLVIGAIRRQRMAQSS